MPLLINSWNPANWKFTRYTNGDSFLSVGKLSTNYKEGEDLLLKTLNNFALFICHLRYFCIHVKLSFILS